MATLAEELYKTSETKYNLAICNTKWDKRKILANSIPKKKNPAHSFLETVTEAKFRYNLTVKTNYYYMRVIITNTTFAEIQLDLFTFQPVYQPKEKNI